MSNQVSLPTAEAALPALRGGRTYLDLSDLPACVSVSVSVKIYSDDVKFVRPTKPLHGPENAGQTGAA